MTTEAGRALMTALVQERNLMPRERPAYLRRVLTVERQAAAKERERIRAAVEALGFEFDDEVGMRGALVSRREVLAAIERAS